MSTVPAKQVGTQWLWWTALFAGAVAPLAAGLRTRERTWIVGGGALLVVQIVGLALGGGSDDATTTTLEDLGVALFGFGWLLSLGFVAAFRGRYRSKMLAASHVEAREAIHAGRNVEREHARALARKDPAEALRRGVGRPDVPGSDHGWVVDVNHAPPAVLETLPGVDPDLARRIVAVRESIGPASSIDDLGLMLDLDARTIERLRATAVAVDI
jgi:DNA uptake protein ComE-like DNA-binding protein